MGIDDRDWYRDAQRERDKQRQLNDTRRKFTSFSSKNLRRQTTSEPASPRQTGLIPMLLFWFVVMGLGSDASLHSASHGAGRLMSRTKAKQSIAWGNVKKKLKELEITVLSAGVDEAPDAYKDIHKVMARQQDLVRVVAQFDPKLVKMAPGGEKAED